MTNSSLAISVRGVEKMYPKKVRALQGVDLNVERGAIFGLLGPNGAGKSTLVKILMTVVHPTRCEGEVLGEPVGRKSTLTRIGYLPEHHKFPDYLTARQALDYYASISGVPRAARRTKMGELLEMTGLTDWQDDKVSGFSKGMRQRLGIANALMHDPDLVLLDEPTDGVDPVGRRDIREMVKALRDRGKTILLNSHLLSELEMVCDRVAILVKGRVVSQGSIDSLSAGGAHYRIELAGAETRDAAARALQLAAADREGVFSGRSALGDSIELTASAIAVGTSEPERAMAVLDALRGAGVVVRSLSPQRPSLEDLFMKAVSDPSLGGSSPGAERGKRRRSK